MHRSNALLVFLIEINFCLLKLVFYSQSLVNKFCFIRIILIPIGKLKELALLYTLRNLVS